MGLYSSRIFPSFLDLILDNQEVGRV